MNADLTGCRTVANDASSGRQQRPVWSPDGQQLAYSNSQGDIVLIEVTGLNKHALTTDPGVDVLPDWSRTDQLVFASNRTTGLYKLYLMDSDGPGLDQYPV